MIRYSGRGSGRAAPGLQRAQHFLSMVSPRRASARAALLPPQRRTAPSFAHALLDSSRACVRHSSQLVPGAGLLKCARAALGLTRCCDRRTRNK